jgi:hypothetical protein
MLVTLLDGNEGNCAFNLIFANEKTMNIINLRYMKKQQEVFTAFTFYLIINPRHELKKCKIN